jgi:large subunit ribosomal protein L4
MRAVSSPHLNIARRTVAPALTRSFARLRAGQGKASIAPLSPEAAAARTAAALAQPYVAPGVARVPTGRLLRRFKPTSAPKRHRPKAVEPLAFYPDVTVQPVVHMPELECEAWVHNFYTREKVGITNLNPEVFAQELRRDLVYRAVNYLRSHQRQGTAHSLGRAEVSGTNKKPFAQKGTGQKRSGSLRSPVDRGGGHYRMLRHRSRGGTDYRLGLEKKVRRRAMQIAVSAKYAEGNLIVLDHACAASHKTQPFVDAFEVWDTDAALFCHNLTDVK